MLRFEKSSLFGEAIHIFCTIIESGSKEMPEVLPFEEYGSVRSQKIL